MDKVTLEIQKNGKAVKKPMSVMPDISYEEFINKLVRYTSKKYRLEYFSETNEWQNLTENAFKALIKNYKKQPINIRTDELQDSSFDNSSNSSLSKSSLSSKTETGKGEDSVVSTESKKEVSSPVKTQEPTKDLSEEIKATLKAYQIKPIVVNPKINEKTEKKERTERIERTEVEERARASGFSDCVKDVVGGVAQYVQKELQAQYKVVREKEQALDLGKTCSQCKAEYFKGPYYICLVCPQEYILCPDCEAKDTINQLNTHKFRSHPLAKIKRIVQTIKTKTVSTLTEEELAFEDRKQQKKLGLRQPQKTEEQIQRDLLLKLQAMYTNLIEKSYYHLKVYENPFNLRLKEGVYHRKNPIEAPGKTGIQQEVVGLSDKEKLQKVKKLKRLNLSEEDIKKYTSGQYENKSFAQLFPLINPKK